MKPGRIAAVVVLALFALPAFALFIGGAVLTVAYAVEQEDGYFDATLDRISSATAAVTTEDLDLEADPGPPEWVVDFVDVSVRLQATNVDQDRPVFIGIGPASDVDAYLAGVAHEEIRDVRPGGEIRYRTIPGTADAEPPGDQQFWASSASGPGTQEIVWDFTEGNWTAVLMNADGSSGLVAVVTAGIKSGALLGIAITMLIVGGVLLVIVVTGIVLVVRGPRPTEEPVPEVEAEERLPLAPEPVRLEASIDPDLSQWKWLVKWFLAIPHYIVLAFLWIAFVILTVVAFFAILFTGRYPRGIFDFNVGVMRWSWRVVFYAATGGLGTDRYPPFTTDPVPDYPADLDVEYPEQLSRGLVLVKWWLLAIPHYLVLGVIVGGAGWWWYDEWNGYGAGASLLGILVFIAVVILLFTGRYPRSLFDLIIGLNRWAFRVGAYATLMTDRYPPFRLDQGGSEPVREDAGVG